MPISHEKKNEILGIIILAFTIILTASLLSYDPNDLPFNTYPPNSHISNYVGVIGAYLADTAAKIFGWGALFLPFIFIYFGWHRFRGDTLERKYIKFAGITGFLFTFCCLLWIFGIGGETYRSGGEAGIIGVGILQRFFGMLGTYIVLISMLSISMLLLLEDLLLFPMILNIKMLFTGQKEASLNKEEVIPEEFLKKKPKPVINLIRNEAVSEAKFVLDKAEKEKNETEKIKKAQIKKPKEEKSEKEEKIEVKGNKKYVLPSLELLEDYSKVSSPNETKEEIEIKSKLLEEALRSFGVEATVVQVHQGPVITRYELQPAVGVKVSQIVNLSDDISLVLKASPIRIVAPIPGKAAVGIEIPNKKAVTVGLRELLENKPQDEDSKLNLSLGKDISGTPFYFDLGRMPHLLIAGATGSGKSICMNSIIMSILYQAEPSEVKLIIVDPKRVEMKGYENIPHLLSPVVTDVKDAVMALKWAVFEMEERYKIFASVGARDIDSYNKLPVNKKTVKEGEVETVHPEKVFYVIVIIDELADLMMSAGNEIEDNITRLAQMARAVGIHLVLATQRPSVDVITGLIKANFPSRIAFQVSSKVDSRTILDQNGAEKLLGGGDMLFSPPGASKPVRLQGAYVSSKEVERITDFVRGQASPEYKEDVFKIAQKSFSFEDGEDDVLFKDAVRVVLESGQASVSLLQRRLKIGYNRAARLVELMEAEGILGPYEVGRSREILVSEDYWEGL
ncbi:MAG: DNA translocase FtsK [bacterium]|nr:DNA translocase FtsK [bacterium]